MARLQVGLTVFLVTVMTVITADVTRTVGKCPRNSPEEIWYSDYALQVNDTVAELRVFHRIIFERLDSGNYLNLMPHIKNDPAEAAKMDLSRIKARKTSWALVEEAVAVMERSWLEAGEAGRKLIEEGGSADEAVRLVKALNETHIKANQLFFNSTVEVASFYKSLVEAAIEGLTQMLESDGEKVDEGKELLERLLAKANQVSSREDMVATVVTRFIRRGLGKLDSRPSRNVEPILQAILTRIDKLVTAFEKFNESKALTANRWANFWEKQFKESLETTNKRYPQEDFERVYRNEAYLAEVLMNVLIHY